MMGEGGREMDAVGEIRKERDTIWERSLCERDNKIAGERVLYL